MPHMVQVREKSRLGPCYALGEGAHDTPSALAMAASTVMSHGPGVCLLTAAPIPQQKTPQLFYECLRLGWVSRYR